MSAARPPEPDAPRPNWRPTFFAWLAASVVAGAVGGVVSRSLGAPVYLGGLFAFVLVGMCGVFALAARVARG